MRIGWREFRRFGQAVAATGATALLCAAGLPGGAGAEHTVHPARTPMIASAVGGASGAGHVTIYPGLSNPEAITVGPDGALWFTNNDSIGRMTPTGRFTAFTSFRMSTPAGITAGPDGALWFTNNFNNSIGRVTTAVAR